MSEPAPLTVFERAQLRLRALEILGNWSNINDDGETLLIEAQKLADEWAAAPVKPEETKP